MSTPTTDQVKDAYKAGAEHRTMSGIYVTQPMMEQDFDNWLRGVQNEAKGPCVGCNYGDGPMEDCPQHGREYAYWVEGVGVVMERERVLQGRIDTVLIAHKPMATNCGPLCEHDKENWPCTTYKILNPECPDCGGSGVDHDMEGKSHGTCALCHGNGRSPL